MSNAISLPIWVQTPEVLVQDLFQDIHLRDQRLNKRLMKVNADCMRNPGKHFNQMYPQRKDEKAAYDLIENERVCPKEMSQAIARTTARDCRGRAVIPAPRDTTTVSFSHRAHPTPGLGPILKDSRRQG